MIKRSDAEYVAHVANCYRRGFICPAEMWSALFDRVPQDRAVDFLAALPQETMAIFRQALAERPESFNHVAAQHPARALVQQWFGGN